MIPVTWVRIPSAGPISELTIMFNEDDYIIEAIRRDSSDLNSPMIGAKIIHRATGLDYVSTGYSSFTANKAECVYQILGLVRRYNEKYETIPFKYFSLILERETS